MCSLGGESSQAITKQMQFQKSLANSANGWMRFNFVMQRLDYEVLQEVKT